MQTFGGTYVPIATYDKDAPKCHPGTRVSFLSRLSNWVTDPESPVDVTWLHGPAGAGKSTIARSLAENMDAEGLLAGSFFFRTDSRRNSEKFFVVTLAYQIARSIPVALRYITKAVEDDPNACSRSLQTQFEMLIVDPVAQTPASESLPPKLIIIDDLDECADQKARSIILKSIFDNLPRLRGHLKFLIISRPEHDIQYSFKSAAASHGQHTDTIELLGDLQAYEDIRVYLHDSFDRTKPKYPLEAHVTSEWPSDDEIEQIVEKSSGLFVYASTVIKYFENDRDEPHHHLDSIVKLQTTSSDPHAELDALYLCILTSSKADRTLLVNILSIIILVDRLHDKVNFRLGDQRRSFMQTDRFIGSILSLRPEDVQLALQDLKSLAHLIPFHRISSPTFIEFWHKSFHDFLLDPLRSKEFCVSPAYASTLVAKGCLRLLSDDTGFLDRLVRNLSPSLLTVSHGSFFLPFFL